MRKEVAAKFTSRCSACGSTIHPGETITYDPAVKYSSQHKSCPAKSSGNAKAPDKPVLLNSPIVRQPQVATLTEERANEILAELGSGFVRPLPAGEPKIGIGYKLTIDGKDLAIGTCNKWVGMATDWKAEPPREHVVSLIDGTVLESAEWRKGKGLGYWTRMIGAPLGMEAHGKNSIQVGAVQQLEGRWYIVTRVDKPYYLSAQAAEDFDMFTRGGGWGTPYEMREIAEPAKKREAREAREDQDRKQADEIIAGYAAAAAQAAELLPLGIRPFASGEYENAVTAIHEKKAEVVATNYTVAEKLPQAVLKLIRDAGRLPKMHGNEHGSLGWEKIYRVGGRLVVDYCDRSYDGSGWMLQGISVAPEDSDILADQKHRAEIRGYRFDAALYDIMVALDAEGTLSKYGRGSYFGGTPSPCRDLPEAERAHTKGAYSHARNQTAAEVRADLIARFATIADDRSAAALAILAGESSVSEI